MKTPIGSLLVIVVASLAWSASSFAAPTELGDIRIGKIEGSVSVVREAPAQKKDLSEVDLKLERSLPDVALGSKKAAKEGYILRQGEAIETGPSSRAVLLFSNGTVIGVEPDSFFSITKFLQDPFDVDKNDFIRAKTEPTTSITELGLKKGTILGDVRKLSKGSKMAIKTPVGTAAIRGTKFKFTVTSLGANGGFTATLSVPEGSIQFSNGNETVTVGGGQAATITVAGNLGQAVQIADPTNITPAEAQALTQAFQALLSEANFSSAQGTTTSSGTLSLDLDEQAATDTGDQGAIDVGTLEGGNNGVGTGASGGGGGGGGGGAQNPPNQPNIYQTTP